MCSSQVSPLSQSGSMAARPCPSGLTVDRCGWAGGLWIGELRVQNSPRWQSITETNCFVVPAGLRDVTAR